ncbi:MAG TPA: NAD(P)-dependent oxidoreductase [Aggregatilinea sp.]|uniref:NAD-dependent epimerase/dehydratase family protein n=1 Tax=Aggregatilinea sp. TaxID=2806333 RepID=UPI002C91AA88|nr:NAD(P)-dependent oxidoreductase [Aggregatilinea sp.]HML21418.1 NAD(P)-dependent oxidoreductase [Aggregatilinea sp.]
MTSTQRILVTGATGKVGQTAIRRLLDDPAYERFTVRALCHNRTLPAEDRLEVVRGSIADRAVVDLAMQDVTHVLHLATSKETPDTIMDVAIKGLFWLLEAARTSPSFEQFILIGGDAAVGHFVYAHPGPVTEAQPHTPYPGCYALSKVLEEVMLEQYYTQVDLNGCCLRAPWIMEKDDFKYQLSFGEDVFGGPRWCDLVGPERAAEYVRTGTIPVMLDPDGQPVLRNFVHVEDLVNAILIAIDHPAARQQTFNICMDEPVNYRAVADYLAQTRDVPSVDIVTPYHSNWLDNTKAKFLLGWRPVYDLPRLIDAAWDYQRAPDDPRVIWYPG